MIERLIELAFQSLENYTTMIFLRRIIFDDLLASFTGAPIDDTNPEVSAVYVEETIMKISQQELMLLNLTKLSMR